MKRALILIAQILLAASCDALVAETGIVTEDHVDRLVVSYLCFEEHCKDIYKALVRFAVSVERVHSIL